MTWQLQRRRVVALLLAGGSGQRSAAHHSFSDQPPTHHCEPLSDTVVPKQHRRLMGDSVSLFVRSLTKLSHHPHLDRVYVVHVAPEQLSHWEPLWIEELQQCVELVIPGGVTRQQSVSLGLEAIQKHEKQHLDLIVIHDAARPCLSDALINRVLDPFEDPDIWATYPVIDVVDTIRLDDHQTVPRDQLHAVQTPQGFVFDRLYQLYQKHVRQSNAIQDATFTDDVELFSHAGLEARVLAIPGDHGNRKVTFSDDFERPAAQNLDMFPRWRNGIGVDIHAFALGGPLRLGGIEIPADRHLVGHSDSDVLIHALCDALYATVGDNDIGHHFPSSDERWKNADSAIFLSHALGLLSDRGIHLSSIDITLLIQQPLLSPHINTIRHQLRQLCAGHQLSVSDVTVKATTTEYLGFVGRSEGITAIAMVTTVQP